MQVGKNSYVTISEADKYVVNYYAYKDEAHLRWFSLPDTSKTTLLLRACAEIESMQFLGTKASTEQAMSFPRRPFTGVPEPIKAAQVELALHYTDEQASKRRELQSQGVSSFTLGDLSETYGDGTQGVNSKALSLLLPFLNGGYETC